MRRSGRCGILVRTMKATVRRTISLPRDLVRMLEEAARLERKTLSAVIEEALQKSRTEYLKAELRALQTYGSRRAKEKGIFTEADLRRYLAK